MKKRMMLITFNKTTQGANQGTQTSISQHNQMRGKMISATKHRKYVFKEVIEYVNSMEGPVDVMIGEDCNQNIASIEVQIFCAELQFKDVHQSFNGLELSQKHHTHVRGIKYAGSIVVTPNLRKHIECSRLFETHVIFNRDNRSCVIGMNLEDCFQEDFSGWDKIERGIPDPNERTHREKFNEQLTKHLNLYH